MTDVDLSNVKEVVQVYRAACSEIKRWEKIRDDLNGTLKGLMNGADIGMVDGVPALRATTVRTARFDAKLFRNEFPELADKYMIPQTYVRLNVIDESA